MPKIHNRGRFVQWVKQEHRHKRLVLDLAFSAFRRQRISNFVLSTFAFILIWLGCAAYYNVGPLFFFELATRAISAQVLAGVYFEDIEDVERIFRNYFVGDRELIYISTLGNGDLAETRLFNLLATKSSNESHIAYKIPFVYESMDAPYIRELREKYGLRKLVAGSHDEYEAMLRIGAWVGTRWDHGVDKVPSGSRVCNPAAVIKAGTGGAKFWCEIAATLMVQTATALGWQARLVTASRDGYTWEHAVAELWSNQYGKWFVMDTDFNVIYEDSGVPLSAFELCHRGITLQERGKLHVKRIAPEKKSLPLVDMIPYYRYIHIDLRNDWCSRPLRRGSPARGDLSTWWTSRPSLNRILTAKIRVDDPTLFDWKVNTVAIHPRAVKKMSNDKIVIELGLSAYSPGFRGFEVSSDGTAWKRLMGSRYSFAISKGIHTVKARALTVSGYEGPISEIKLRFQDALNLSFVAGDYR